MRTAIAWILLLVGIVAGAAGAARNGAAHTAHGAAARVAGLLYGAVGAGAAAAAAARDAEAATVSAPDADAARATAAAAQDRLAKAQARVDALRASGALPPGDDATAVAALRAAVPPLPGPAERWWGWLQAGGLPWVIGVVLIAIGAWLARSEQARRNATAGEGGAVDLPKAITTLLDEIDALQPEIDALPLDGPSVTLRARLDRLQDEVLTPLVEGRGQLVAKHGLSRFAVYFGALSAGERNLARAWTALTDGHTPTAQAALRDARAAFVEAREAWDQAEAG